MKVGNGRKISRWVGGLTVVVAVLSGLWPAGVARAQSGVTETEIGCDDRGLRCREVSASISFPDGIEGRLLLSFEDATLLNDETFDIQAELVGPRDPEVVSRLPRGTFIPEEFPVLLTIEPRRGAQLSFRRNWTLELVSENLEFSSHTPFRLFRAPTGGAFEDISFSLGSGSFRVRGLGASFSEFLIAADLRPIERIAGRKLLQLENRLAEHADEIPDVVDELSQIVTQVRQSLESGDVARAVALLDGFVARVRSASGTDIPDDTRPADGEEAIAARLLTSARTLRHSLFLSLESAQGGMSGFSRRLTAPNGMSFDLSMEFEETFVVDPEDLEFSAEVIDVNDPALLGRLPDGVHVPEEFPVLIHVNPKSGADQAFSGRYEIEVRTDRLRFLGGTPLRLFKAPDGGAFEDVTRTFGLGSFRVRGLGASFSEFLIVEDMRPVESIVAAKFEDAVETLQDNASEIPPALRNQLANALTQAQMNVAQGLVETAIDGLETVVATIRENSGETIPALWRSGESAENVAGELVAALESLIFSLEIQDAPTSADPADANRDGVVDVGDVFFVINRVFGDTSPPALVFDPPNADEEP